MDCPSSLPRSICMYNVSTRWSVDVNLHSVRASLLYSPVLKVCAERRSDTMRGGQIYLLHIMMRALESGKRLSSSEYDLSLRPGREYPMKMTDGLPMCPGMILLDNRRTVRSRSFSPENNPQRNLVKSCKYHTTSPSS